MGKTAHFHLASINFLQFQTMITKLGTKIAQITSQEVQVIKTKWVHSPDNNSP